MHRFSIRERILCQDNDWTALGQEWSRWSTDPLRGEIHSRPDSSQIPIQTSVSILIPAWNAESTISACLAAIEQSSFRQLYPQLLQVIVVDDGSTDSTWNILRQYCGALRLHAIRQKHSGQTPALNTAIAHAQGDVVICCDADMLLNVWAIHELVVRHQVLENILLVGFRGNLNPNSDKIPAVCHHDNPPLRQHVFSRDNRFCFEKPGWPENMYVESDGLRKLGWGRRFLMSTGAVWDLARMVYGCLFSLPKSFLLSIGGFDERLVGWGFSDTLVGAKAKASGYMIVPVISANGWHIHHSIRTPTQWTEGRLNRERYERIIDESLNLGLSREVTRATVDYRIEAEYEWPGNSRRTCCEIQDLTPIANLTDKARLYFALGDYSTAAETWLVLAQSHPYAHIERGRALRCAGLCAEAVYVFRENRELLSNTGSLVEYALALAALRDFSLAHKILIKAYEADSHNGLCRYILTTSRERHLERARFYANQAFTELARRDCEAALLQDPHDHEASKLLESLEQLR